MLSQRQQRLQDRINEEPAPGIKLAARSVRIGPDGKRMQVAVPSVRNPSKSSAFRFEEENVSTTNANDESKEVRTNSTIPVIGTVVERKTSNRRRSRPAVANGGTQLPPPSTGFPSIQAQPLGTFVTQTTTSIPTVPPPATIQNNKMKSTSPPSSLDTTTATTSLLEQMSTQEIQESIQELHSKLSPEMIQFLKNRSRRTSSSSNSQHKIAPPPTLQIPPNIPPMDDSKLQMAQVMSSIHSYDDLDAAYNQYVSLPENSESQSDSTKTNKKSTKRISLLDDSYTIHEIVNGNDDNQIDHDTQFHLACQLLRSTSLQQTLWASRIVCHRLQYETQEQQRVAEVTARPCYTYNLQPILPMNVNDNPTRHWPFPILLPVALRCLLDAPYHYGNTISRLQTTYVLQSIYILLQLRAGPDHVVQYFTNEVIPMKDASDCDATAAATSVSRSLIYQIDCLNDVIPTVPVRYCYAAAKVEPMHTDGVPTLGIQSNNMNTSQQQATYCFKSDSNSKSAEMDGQAFARDPMWTLLSKMRMIPRLAQILQQNNCRTANADGDDDRANHSLPIEARQAICGILAMIGQRSPGAATAIVHHPTILQDLLSPLFLYRCSINVNTITQQEQQYDPKITVPVLHLLSTLSRQSRAAAEGVYERMSTTTDNCPSGLLLHILLLHTNDLHEGEKKTKNDESHDKTATANHKFDVQQWSVILWRTLLRYGFGLELLPTMMTLSSAHLTLGFHDSSLRVASLAPEWYSCFAVILHGISTCNNIDESVSAILSSPSLQRQSLHHLQEISENIVVIESNCEVKRLATSLLMYWKALLNFSAQETDSAVSIQVRSSVHLLLSVLNTILTKMRMKRPMVSALRHCLSPDFNDTLVASDSTSLKQEVQSIAFWEALLDLALMLRQSPFVDMTSTELSSSLQDFEQNLEKKIIDELEEIMSTSTFMADPTTSPPPLVGLASRYGLNKVQALVVTFLCRQNVQFHIDRARAMAFTIIGRLNIGEECTAFMLFGNHKLFHPGMASTNVSEPSPVSALLLQELFRTPKSHKQLDHSCKLNFTCRETSQACFDIQSLLTDTGENSDLSSAGTDDLLPVGKYWLWKLLAGDTGSQQHSKALQSAETVPLSVLSTSLGLMEDMAAHRSATCAVDQLGDGAKLYYLTNICLQGEHVLSNNKVLSIAEKMFSLYFYSDHWGNTMELANECQSHLDPKISSNSSSSTPETNSTTEDKVLKEILDPIENNSLGWSKSHIRSIETYVGDLYDSYMDFGVQYEFCTKSIRLFLVKEFPTKIRLGLLNRFRNTLHLLSIQDDEKNIIPLLSRFLLGGMPTFDQSARDDPELIDGITLLYCNGSTDRPDDKFVKLWAISLIARSLAISISTQNKSGLVVAKRRMRTLDTLLASRIACTAHLWLKSEGSLRSLIDTAIQSEIHHVPFKFDDPNWTDTNWEELVNNTNSYTLQGPNER